MIFSFEVPKRMAQFMAVQQGFLAAATDLAVSQ